MSPSTGALFISLLAACLTYTGAQLFFRWRHGPPPRPGALRRDLARVAGNDPAASDTPWRRAWQRWWRPPGVPPARFRLLWLGTWLALLSLGLLLLRSWWLAGPFSLGALACHPILVAHLHRTRRALLNDQLKDALGSLAASLRAGASVPTALERCVEDLRRLLRGQPDTPIIAELEQVVRDLHLGAGLEQALIRLRERAGLEDVDDFVNAILLCRTRGGNLAEVMGRIALMIGDKIAVRRQVHVLTAGKRMEAWLLTLTPPVIVGAITASSPDYLAPLYGTLLGQVLMVLGAAMLVAAFIIGRRIVEIDV